jgi:hypothetical protein
LTTRKFEPNTNDSINAAKIRATDRGRPDRFRTTFATAFTQHAIYI